MNSITNVGIGFVTGRKQFQNVLKSYVNNWNEHGLIENRQYRFNLFVAYDLKYFNTQISDYKNIDPAVASLVDRIHFYGDKNIETEVGYLVSQGVVTKKEADLIFGEGYGKKRNIVMYFALKNKMDRLIFIDDDEYPVATIKNEYQNILWMGQSVVGTHLEHIINADITHGRHCGYISPIPYIQFNDVLNEDDFRIFIDAISNDIISWDSIRTTILENNGVTFADGSVIKQSLVTEVEEQNGMKFISGANLCFNLQTLTNIPPFYNPPGARGEDTFMSTCLSDIKVNKLSCYTFHDGFLNYANILHGVLPRELMPIIANSPAIINRFIKASIGWIRYKPLMLYITRRSEYNNLIDEIEQKLDITIPKLCRYFKTDEFTKMPYELSHYHKNVERHFNNFEETKRAWSKIVQFIRDNR